MSVTIVMERRKLENIVTNFQAQARGYLVRREMRHACKDFEDIVREIDGHLTHLQWRSTVIPIPHFTDTDGPLLRPSSEAAAALLSQDRGDDQALLTRKIQDERHESQSKGHESPISNNDGGVEGCGQRDKEKAKDREAPENVGGSTTTIWSSFELDVNHSYSDQGSRQYCSAQEVPRTPEALRLHRNTLTMELVWLQQAIDSRKKYLSLKGRLAIP